MSEIVTATISGVNTLILIFLYKEIYYLRERIDSYDNKIEDIEKDLYILKGKLNGK